MIQFSKQEDEQFNIGCQLSSRIPVGLSIAAIVLTAVDLSDDSSDATAIVLNSATPTVTIIGTEIRFLVRDGTAEHKYEITAEVTLTPGTPSPLIVFTLIMNVT